MLGGGWGGMERDYERSVARGWEREQLDVVERKRKKKKEKKKRKTGTIQSNLINGNLTPLELTVLPHGFLQMLALPSDSLWTHSGG